MLPDEQPTIPVSPPSGSRPSPPGVWQAPSVEEMQAMLPQYEVLEILGRGGMGAVYKGRQKSLKRLVAIKILPLGMADDEMKFAERFQNEAQTMAAMNHPAIVSVHDFGETPDGLLYFIMEFVDGTDVHKMIQASGRLSDEYALAITAHVCDALAYAHKRGVIHRDIKPANILIDQEGHIKVADFGLAKMHDPSQTSGLTKTNMAMGTPDYVAPEVLTPGKVADHRADLYAVGVMLYQMLTGEVPRGMFKLPSQTGIGSDARFDDIICKALEPKPEDRYQSAMDVRHALDVILTTPQPKDDGKGIVSMSQIPKKPVAKQPRPPGERTQPPPQKKPEPQKAPAQKAAAAPKAKAAPGKKSPATLWLSIGGIVTVLGLASFFALGGKSEPAVRVQPGSASPVDAAFLAQVAAAPAARQVELVTQKIEALNGAKVTAEPTITGEKVTGLRLARADGTEVRAPDVSPLAALKELDSLLIENLNPKDISCLRGLKLVNLTIWSGEFNDVSVLQSHPLQTLSLRQTPVSDFSMLKGKALKRLDLELCDRLSDISFIKAMPLEYLRVPRTKVRDLSPIARLPLVELVCDPEAKLDPALIASIPTLKKINSKPVSEWLGGSSNPPPSATQGKVIDLLALVDVNRDVVAGQWVRTADELVKTGGIGGGPRLQLPYQPAEEYDFEIEFTTTGGSGNIGQILTAQGREFGWMLNTGDQGNHRAGFGLLDGKKTTEVTETTAPLKEGIVDGRRYRSRIEVRAGRLRAFLDDAEIVNWTGDFSRLANDVTGKLRDSGHIGLRLNRDAVFHKITVREITGTGKVDAGVSATTSVGSSGAPTAWTDWLGPRLAKGQFADKPDLVVEKDGITSNQLVTSIPFDKGTVVRGPVRMTYLLRESEWTQFVFSINPLTNETYRAEDKGSELRIFRCGKEGANQTILASEKIPAAISRTAERTLEFRVDGNLLRATLNGTFSLSAQDATLATVSGSFHSISFKKGLLLKKVEIAAEGAQGIGTSKGEAAGSSPTASTIPWTDWLGPRLAKGQYQDNGFVPEKDGITTDQGMKGTNITADDTMDGAIKLTYLLRDSKGVQITVRSRGIGDTRELYVVEDSGSGIYIGRILGNKTTMLVSEKYPATISRTGERTLEFRAEGASLVATVNGTFSVSAHDTTLTKGPSSFVIMKGLLLKKVEIASSGVPGIGISNVGTVPAAPPSPATTWTDWLAPKLASGGFVDDGWAREAGGVTTDQPIKGIGIIRDEVKDGAVRLTGLVQGGGMQITARERNTTAVRELYVAGDTGDGLYIGRMIRYDTVVTLVRKEYPPGITRDGEHTLEFRCVGSTLTATLNGTFTITTEDSNLTQGAWTVVLKRGAVMKKVEIAD